MMMRKLDKIRDVFFQSIVIVCVFILLFMSSTVILGWNLHSTRLIHIFSAPDNIAMVYNTAICFLLMAVCLLLLLSKQRNMVFFIAFLVIIISLTSFLQNFHIMPINIDQSIMHHFESHLNRAPGQMSPNTSICFLLSAISCIILVFNRTIYTKFCMLPILFVLIIIGLNLLYALGYVAQLPMLYSWGKFTSISPHTMIAFVALAVGIFSLTIHMCIIERINYTKVLAGFVALATALGIFILWEGVNLEQKQNMHNQIRLNVKNEINQLAHAVNQDMLLVSILNLKGTYAYSQEDMTKYLRQYMQDYPYHEAIFTLSDQQALQKFPQLITGEQDAIILPTKEDKFYILSPTNNNTVIISTIQLSVLLDYLYPEDIDNYYYLRIIVNNYLMLDTFPPPPFSKKWVVKDEFYTETAKWEVEFMPTALALKNAGENPIPIILLCVGLFMTLLLFLALHFSYRNARQINRLNKYQDELLAAEKIANLGYWSFEKEEDLLILSDMAKEIFNIEHNEISFTDFIERFDSEGCLLLKDILLKNNGEPRKPYILNLKIKDTIFKTIVMELLTKPNQKDTKIRGIIQDISEFKSLERQLEHAQKMEIVGRLSGGIAHDFNNLLMIIQGNLELIEISAQLDEKNHERINNAIAAIERSANLTKRLLAFSRMQMLKPEIVDLKSYIKSMVSLIKPTLGDSITFNMNFAEGLWDIRVDISQFETAIINIALNSRDAITGQGMFSIDCENVVLGDEIKYKHYDIPPGEYVKISVSDTGSGISPEILPHVFEPFFTTKPMYKGSGLGLSMLYGFIKQSKGHVTIYSHVGSGTTLCLYLPKAVENDESNSQPEKSIISETFSQKYKILIVEDERNLMTMVNDYLSSLGHEVIMAENADQAIGLLQQNPDIQILFTDVVMPGKLNGIELGETAKKLIPNIKTMFASGYARAVLSENYELPSGTILLNKPYRMIELSEKIHELLKQ